MADHDTPTDEQRIATLESEVGQMSITIATIGANLLQLRKTMELQFPYLKQKHCRFCTHVLDPISGRCPNNCKTKMGG